MVAAASHIGQTLHRLLTMSPGTHRILRFLLVGGVGFAVDAGVLTLLREGANFPLLGARLVSFGSASFVTWLFNRLLVFADRRQPGLRAAGYSNREEYLRYMAVQIIGAGTNLLVFFLVSWSFPTWGRHVVVPLAVGAIVSAAITYTLLNAWLFRAESRELS